MQKAKIDDKAIARIKNRQASGEMEYQHVDSSLPVIDGLRPINEVIVSIREKMDNIHMRKRKILEELIYLAENWTEYTQDDDLIGYAGETGLFKFLQEKVDQHISTSYADVRIARMLASYRLAQYIKLDGKLNSLKRIAYMSDKRNPERAEQERKRILLQLPDLSNREVEERIDEFNKQKGVIREYRRTTRRPWELAVSPNRGKIQIKQITPETAKKLGKLLELLDEDRLDEMLSKYQPSKRVKQGELLEA